jgi:hypothetical protein
MSKNLKIALGVTIGVVGLMVAVVPSLIRARTGSPNPCLNNLRQIEGAKQQWALENRKATNEVATWPDVDTYMRSRPVCPKGGTYLLGRIADPVRCSIGGPSHTLP